MWFTKDELYARFGTGFVSAFLRWREGKVRTHIDGVPVYSSVQVQDFKRGVVS